MSKSLKILNLGMALALLLCLCPMPYSYFVFVRFVAMVFFAYMAYHYYQIEKMPLVWSYGTLALLFQPLLKISLGREVWNVVDVIVAMFLICIILKNR